MRRDVRQYGAINWLRDELQVPWPTTFVVQTSSTIDVDGHPVEGGLRCWSRSAIEYALANGCGWGNWRCQHYDAGWYDEEYFAKRAQTVLAWAHKQEDCPCTCEANDTVNH